MIVKENTPKIHERKHNQFLPGVRLRAQMCGVKYDILQTQIYWISRMVHLSVLRGDKATFPLMGKCQKKK